MPIPLLSPGEGDSFDLPDSAEEFDLDDADFESHGLTTNSYVHRQSTSWTHTLWSLTTLRWRVLLRPSSRWQKAKQGSHRRPLHYRNCGRRLRLIAKYLLLSIVTVVIITATFWPSYNDLPAHYGALRKKVLESNDEGRANGGNQKIFIAASIYDKGGHLVSGRWGKNVLNLIDLVGRRNVFVSIYENEGGPEAEKALKDFEGELHCNKSLVYEHLPVEDIPEITLPDGTRRIKRIAYLAEVRNRALKPLEGSIDVVYDKILFLNDVLFDPIDAVQLLLSTNANEEGQASYKAACAVDFINPFKFYDTFATRDLEGYSMGIPFYPWYSSAGGGFSRQDVLDGKDAVRVKSCWGGMAAFDASFFQAGQTPHDVSGKDALETSSHAIPVRFRAVSDLDWEASECCLVHADILGTSARPAEANDTGIYQNPFVRVAYGPKTLWWLPITRRFERLYTIPHTILDRLVGLPWFNPRRSATDKVHGGRLNEASADPRSLGDGYCGMRTLQLMRESRREGEKNWETVPVPPA